MPDTALAQALKEAYASAPANEIIYSTLEINHESFEAPIRVVRGSEDITATLEPDAPVNGGEAVGFVRYHFDIVKPERTPGGVAQCTITIDNVSRSIYQALHDAAISASPVTVIYREFLASSLSTPQQVPPYQFTAVRAEVNALQASITVVFADISNKALGKRAKYTPERFPGLLQ